MIRIEGSKKSFKIKKPLGSVFKRILEKLTGKKKIKLKIISLDSNEIVYTGFECYLEKNEYLYHKDEQSWYSCQVELTRECIKKIKKYNKENNTHWTCYPYIRFENLHLPNEKIIKNYLKNE